MRPKATPRPTALGPTYSPDELIFGRAWEKGRMEGGGVGFHDSLVEACSQYQRLSIALFLPYVGLVLSVRVQLQGVS